MAQYQFNTQNIDGARDYLLQAENNWQHIQRDQLVILRAQRDNIVAHISYTAYLETGSEDSRLQSITQFRKVQREARRGKLTSMFEHGSKMQFHNGRLNDTQSFVDSHSCHQICVRFDHHSRNDSFGECGMHLFGSNYYH